MLITFNHSKLNPSIIKLLLLVFFSKAFSEVFRQLILKIE
jgi:hypothetical protein